MLKAMQKRKGARGAAATALAVLLSVSVTSQAPAQAESDTPVTARLDGSSLVLAWAPVEGVEAYLVVDERSGEVLWRGSFTSHTEPVAAPASRSLLLFADNGEEATLLGKTLAMVPDASATLKPAIAVTTRSGTTLSWRPVAGTSGWSLSDDGGLRESSVGGLTTSVAQTLESDERAVEVAAQTLVDGELTRVVNGFALTEPSYTAADVGGDAQEGDVIAAGVYPITTSRVPYETYIPFQYIDAPDTGSPFDCESGDGSDYWYAGDNRGLAYNSGKYRTRGLSTYYWTSASTLTTKSVSSTTRYKKTSSGYSYDSRRQAGSEGFIMNPVTNNGRDALTQINHSVGQPYCSAMNNIDYDIRQEMHQNGGHFFYGRHDRMPNHQLYRSDQRSDGSTSVSLVFHHKLTDPKCLNWAYPCPQWQYQYSR